MEAPKQHSDDVYTFKPFRVPKFKIEFSKANGISDVPGYSWYTPAALYLWGQFSETTLSDIVSKKNLSIFWYQFEQPIFQYFQSGSDKSWNHTLWAVKDSEKSALVDGILESVQFDIPNKLIYQYAMQSFNIADPLTVDKEKFVGPSTKKVEIMAFAVLSNQGQYAFNLRSSKPGLPGMSKFKPDNLHVSAASRLFSIPNLNTDKAFDAYKTILNDQQDTNRYDEQEKEWNKRVKK
jgi:hypothetical protein